MPTAAGRSAGNFESNAITAWTPPAEAPIVTMSRATPSAFIPMGRSLLVVGGHRNVEIDRPVFADQRAHARGQHTSRRAARGVRLVIDGAIVPRRMALQIGQHRRELL